MRFTIHDRSRTREFQSHSALAALSTDAARSSLLGADLVDESGKVIARRGRVWVESAWLESWLPTEAWPEEELSAPSLDAAELLEDVDAPLFLTGSADDGRTSPGPQRSAQALADRAIDAPRQDTGVSSGDRSTHEHTISASPPRDSKKETRMASQQIPSTDQDVVRVEVETYRELRLDADVDVGPHQIALRDPDNGDLFVVSRHAFVAHRIAKTQLAAVQGA